MTNLTPEQLAAELERGAEVYRNQATKYSNNWQVSQATMLARAHGLEEAAALVRANTDPRIERMREAIQKAAAWFDDYERQHRLKRTQEGELKADTNQERAAWLRATLEE